ncbi:cytochrome C oxidase subunit IV family protein, partial [Bacillus cereus group sp. Bce002]
MRTLTLCWLALLALAVTGVLLGGAGDSPWLLAAVLACAVAKGWLIGERFMEL